MKENNQKIKLIKLTDFLKTESSKEKPLSTKEIIDYLNELGISCDRRTLYRDMKTLAEQGLNVIKTECGRENGYYIKQQNFSLAEIKILIDAVQSANFITNSKTEELIKKILNLAGARKQEVIRENIIFYNSHKHSNEEIYDTIEKIEYAIEHKKQITFCYFDLDEKNQRVYRKERKRYIADSIALIFEEENYYLLSYSKKYQNNTTYRLDRMSEVQVELTNICDEAKIRKRTTDSYTKQVFRMYNGETTHVVLQMDLIGIGKVYDKFGEDTKIKKINDIYYAKVKVQISPPFLGWLLQYSEHVKLIEPSEMVYDLKSVLYTCLGKNLFEGAEQ